MTSDPLRWFTRASWTAKQADSRGQQSDVLVYSTLCEAVDRDTAFQRASTWWMNPTQIPECEQVDPDGLDVFVVSRDGLRERLWPTARPAVQARF